MTSCEQIQPKLLDFSRSQLSALETREIREHLAGCAECRELLAEEESLDGLLRDIPPAVPRMDMWPLVRARVRGRQPVLTRVRVRLGTPKRALATGLAVAAIALAIILGQSHFRPQVTPTDARAVAALIQSAQPTDAYDDPMGDNTSRMLAAIEEGI